MEISKSFFIKLVLPLSIPLKNYFNLSKKSFQLFQEISQIQIRKQWFHRTILNDLNGNSSVLLATRKHQIKNQNNCEISGQKNSFCLSRQKGQQQFGGKWKEFEFEGNDRRFKYQSGGQAGSSTRNTCHSKILHNSIGTSKRQISSSKFQISTNFNKF